MRADLALRMIRLADDGSRYAMFLEPYHARDLVRTAVQLYHLSARESAVLDHMLHGATTVAIAAELGIEQTTVLQHIKNIGLKVGVTKRSAIVAAVLGTMPVAADARAERARHPQRLNAGQAEREKGRGLSAALLLVADERTLRGWSPSPGRRPAACPGGA